MSKEESTEEYNYSLQYKGIKVLVKIICSYKPVDNTNWKGKIKVILPAEKLISPIYSYYDVTPSLGCSVVSICDRFLTYGWGAKYPDEKIHRHQWQEKVLYDSYSKLQGTFAQLRTIYIEQLKRVLCLNCEMNEQIDKINNKIKDEEIVLKIAKSINVIVHRKLAYDTFLTEIQAHAFMYLPTEKDGTVLHTLFGNIFFTPDASINDLISNPLIKKDSGTLVGNFREVYFSISVPISTDIRYFIEHPELSFDEFILNTHVIDSANAVLDKRIKVDLLKQMRKNYKQNLRAEQSIGEEITNGR